MVGARERDVKTTEAAAAAAEAGKDGDISTQFIVVAEIDVSRNINLT